MLLKIFKVGKISNIAKCKTLQQREGGGGYYWSFISFLFIYGPNSLWSVRVYNWSVEIVYCKSAGGWVLTHIDDVETWCDRSPRGLHANPDLPWQRNGSLACILFMSDFLCCFWWVQHLTKLTQSFWICFVIHNLVFLLLSDWIDYMYSRGPNLLFQVT